MNAIFLHQPARYRELSVLLPQASSSTLAETLGALEAAHLILRHASEGVPTSSYSLSESGVKLLKRLKPLLDEVQQ